MARAIARQDYAAEFAEYLLQQLRVPAQRIVQASRNRHGAAVMRLAVAFHIPR